MSLMQKNAWIQTIQSALSWLTQPASFDQLQLATHLQPGELWLALLLGQQHWSIHQQVFYGEISVSLNQLSE